MVRGGLGLGPELQEITGRIGRAETRPPPHSNEVEAGQGACSGGWRSGAKDGGRDWRQRQEANSGAATFDDAARWRGAGTAGDKAAGSQQRLRWLTDGAPGEVEEGGEGLGDGGA